MMPVLPTTNHHGVNICRYAIIHDENLCVGLSRHQESPPAGQNIFVSDCGFRHPKNAMGKGAFL
jgi:hypothetical protein